MYPPTEVWVLKIEDNHGVELSAYTSEEALERGLLKWVSHRWSSDQPPLASFPDDRAGTMAAITDYFELNSVDESWVADKVPLQE